MNLSFREQTHMLSEIEKKMFILKKKNVAIIPFNISLSKKIIVLVCSITCNIQTTMCTIISVGCVFLKVCMGCVHGMTM